MNIFAFLPNDSDDENNDQKKDVKPVKAQEKKTGAATEKKQAENPQNNNQQVNNQQNRNQRPQTNQRQYNQNRGDNNQNYNNNRDNNQNYNNNRDQNRDQQYRPRPQNDGNGEQPRREYKPRVQRDKDERKPKGVPSEPHPQDRHSGTGNPAFLKNDFRKGGAGKGNFGTIKDELVGREELKDNQQQPQQQQEQQQQPEEVQEPVVVDNTITLAEYYSKLGVTQTEEKQVQQQKQLNEEDLKKEKLQLVHSRNEKQLDTQIVKAQNKGKKGPTTYQVGCNSEHSSLLGVKSGTTLVQYTVKKEGEQIVGEVKREPKKDNNSREQRNPQAKQPHQNRKPKVNVENEDDFPKLG